jgi:hypothetical protein
MSHSEESATLPEIERKNLYKANNATRGIAKGLIKGGDLPAI